jgi:DNA polymerase V
VGIAQNKTLFKLINHIAKKRPAFDSVCNLSALPQPVINDLFSTFDVNEVRGVDRPFARLAVHANPSRQSLSP